MDLNAQGISLVFACSGGKSAYQRSYKVSPPFGSETQTLNMVGTVTS